MKPARAYTLIVVCALLWCAGIVVAPIAESLHVDASPLYYFYGKICHQIDARSLHIAGAKLAVCSRCTGLYGGFLAGLLLVPYVLRHPIAPGRVRLVLCCAAAPMLADVALNAAGFVPSTIATKMLSGVILGPAIAVVTVPEFLGALHTITFFTRRSHADKT